MLGRRLADCQDIRQAHIEDSTVKLRLSNRQDHAVQASREQSNVITRSQWMTIEAVFSQCHSGVATWQRKHLH